MDGAIFTIISKKDSGFNVFSLVTVPSVFMDSCDINEGFLTTHSIKLESCSVLNIL